ncbi:hypothetical protein LLH23_01680 [bacterium]|nr:hypothetical protein [bacterium]
MEQELHTLKDMRGTWDPKQPGFSVSGHLSRSGGPGTKTIRGEPVNRGDETSTGLVTTLTEKWTAEVSWTYSYNRSPVEAIIKPTGEYKKWIPPASTKQGTAGGTISFNVELRDKKTGGKPKNTTATFQFKLLETSKEPGSCMNSPWNDTEPDLKILKDDNAGLEKVDPNGQGARSKPKLTECPITVSCFDGGAHGRLQVVAELSDGPPITAILQEDDRTEVGLPYDEDGNHIADAWEQDKGVSGQSGEVDDEQAPPVTAPAATA